MVDTTPAGDLSKELFEYLKSEYDLPEIDLDDPEFEIPDLGDLTDLEDKLTEKDLTERIVEGSGMFDGLMQATGAQLESQLNKGRLTSAQFAEAYSAAMGMAMSTAMQYLLGKDQAYWQGQHMKLQAALAAVTVVQAKVQLQETKARLAIALIEAQTAEANHALTKMKLSTEDAQYELLLAQKENVVYQTTALLPAQKEDIEAGILLKDAQEEQVRYETANIQPAQLLKLGKETDTLDYQLTKILPAQHAGYLEDNTGKEFTNEFLLPAQLESTKEQTEAHRAKTLDTRTDGITPVKGAVGKQKDLYDQQITSYKRESEYKFLRSMLDSWIAQKSIDEGLTAPSSLGNPSIDEVVNLHRANLDLD